MNDKKCWNCLHKLKEHIFDKTLGFYWCMDCDTTEKNFQCNIRKGSAYAKKMGLELQEKVKEQ